MPGTKMQVVIVDDDLAILNMMRTLAGRLEHCMVHAFHSPRLALDFVSDHVPDLVLLDYMMPDLDGLEFLAAFRKLPGRQDVPVIMITSAHEAAVRHQALELGANDFLNKPLDFTDFAARSRNMLTLRRHQKELADRADWLAAEVLKATEDIRQREQGAIFLLSRAAEYRDPETGAQIARMASYSRLVASKLGVPYADQQLLFEAAPMHDIGKVGIPDNILLKPGRLEPAEFDVMKTHAQIGYDLLVSAPFKNPLFDAAATVALNHHEKFDGTGYPNGLRGHDIPLFGRIVAVADVFDALTSARPYKPAWTLERTRAHLEEQSGKHFDPECLRTFLAHWDEVLKIRATYVD